MKGKDTDQSFLNYIKRFHIIALLETWCDKLEDFDKFKQLLPEYTVFVNYSNKSKRQGRSSGGVAVFVRTDVIEYIKPIQLKFNFGLAFLVDNILCTSTPFIIIFVYLPPFGAKVYSDSDEPNGVAHLENYINLLYSSYPDIELIISGDFNARTKNLPDYIVNDSSDYLPTPEYYKCDTFSIPRKSRDLHGELNPHGKLLLDLCCVHSLHMLNGRTRGDMDGHLTCFTANGCSLVDYTIASTDLFPLIDSFEIGQYDELTHLPQIFQLMLPIVIPLPASNPQNEHRNEARCNESNRLYYKWTPESLDKILHSDHLALIDEKINNNDIGGAIDTLNTMIQTACIQNKIKKKHANAKQKEWWDAEMKDLKHKKYSCLR